MKIEGKVHCFFEQSGTFKNEFIKLGIPAEDYDIQNDFGETDHQADLFKAIEDAYDGEPSLFDQIRGGQEDLIMAFFPCIYFSDMSQILHTWGAYPKYDTKKATDIILDRSEKRQAFYKLCVKMLAVAKMKGIRLVMENPWGTQSFLRNDFITPPALIDKNRNLRGEVFRKPTAYWFINCEPTYGSSLQQNCKPLRVKKDVAAGNGGICNKDRSMISPDYARNFICDFIIGKEQNISQMSLF